MDGIVALSDVHAVSASTLVAVMEKPRDAGLFVVGLLSGQPWDADFSGCTGAVLRWVFPLELKAVTFARSGVLPRISIRPPCLRNATRSEAMLWLVMIGPGLLPWLLRLVCGERVLRLLVALFGMRFPSFDSPLASSLLAGGGVTYPGQ